jgi:hypothetical protein
MSGGSLNYISYTIEEALVGKMEDPELNDLVKDVAQLSHDLEWYKSGDTGEDDYKKSVAMFKKKWFKTSRKERLDTLIDQRIEATRKELYEMIDVPVEVKGRHAKHAKHAKEKNDETR